MNDWDRMFKSADTDELPEPEPFQVPEGFVRKPFPADEYGYYGTDADGTLTLLGVNPADTRTSYEIQKGCTAVLRNALSDQPFLQEIRIPAEMRFIPEGAFSNSGSWAEEEKGIRTVRIEPGNGFFLTDANGFYEKLPDGGKKLLLYFLPEKKTEVFLSKDIRAVGEKAFYGRTVSRVTFEENGFSYSFPSHAYFREELLKEFGKNGKLYDFEKYDAFLLRKHFNAERLRMTCERLMQPWQLTDQVREALLLHVRSGMNDVVEALDKENAVAELLSMTEAGIFDRETAEKTIELLNRTGQREMLSYLMDYKMQHFGTEEFDFSI